MRKLFVGSILWILCYSYSFHINTVPIIKSLKPIHSFNRFPTSRAILEPLFAKKKPMISSDVMAQIQSQLTGNTGINKEESSSPLSHEQQKKNQKDNKKKKNKHETSDANENDDENGNVSNKQLETKQLGSKDNQKNHNKKPAKKFTGRPKFAQSVQPSFASLGIQQLEMIYANTAILQNATFAGNTGDRVGLVGPNGSGKSTILKLLSGLITPNQGNIQKTPSNLRISYLKQEFIDELQLNHTLYQELLTSFTEEQNVLMEIKELEAMIGQLHSTNHEEMTEPLDEAYNTLQDLQHYAIQLGAYLLDHKILKVIDSMGFTRLDLNKTIDMFSGGWKMRIGLAKILCSDPNFLLLDEPTNHMDFESVLWLESFLKNQTIPMIVISHDREFLNQICNKIIDVEEGKTITYHGNYNLYLSQRNERRDLWKLKYEKQCKHVNEEEKWLRKSKSDSSIPSSVLKQREQTLNKLKASKEFVLPPPKDRKFRFRFPYYPRGNNALVVEANDVTFGYPSPATDTSSNMVSSSPILQNINFEIMKGNRIGFIGPNGSGKSTMIKLILQSIEPLQGSLSLGSELHTKINYYAQNAADLLPLNQTILQVLLDVVSEYEDDYDHNSNGGGSGGYNQEELRTLLGQFMFKGDDVYKPIKVLSGGEKARVALCRMMLIPANVLILDEPTNHLDITGREVLEDALLNYPGSVIIVSHDRFFISQVVNTIFAFEPLSSSTMTTTATATATTATNEGDKMLFVSSLQDDSNKQHKKKGNGGIEEDEEWMIFLKRKAEQFGDKFYELPEHHIVDDDDEEEEEEDDDNNATDDENESDEEETEVEDEADADDKYNEQEEELIHFPTSSSSSNNNVVLPTSYSIVRYDCDYYQYLDRVETKARRRLQGLKDDEDDDEQEDEYEEEEEEDEEEAELRAIINLHANPNKKQSSSSNSYKNKNKQHPSPATTATAGATETNGNVNTTTVASLKEKMATRYLPSDMKYRITPAKRVLATSLDDEKVQRSRNYGGSGISSRDSTKGIKNAKRYNW